MDKISVVIPVNNETKKSVRGYDEYGTVRVARQVPRVFGHIVGFTDVRIVRMLFCIPAKYMVGEFNQ